jgi:hypothetical protein
MCSADRVNANNQRGFIPEHRKEDLKPSRQHLSKHWNTAGRAHIKIEKSFLQHIEFARLLLR